MAMYVFRNPFDYYTEECHELDGYVGLDVVVAAVLEAGKCDVHEQRECQAHSRRHVTSPNDEVHPAVTCVIAAHERLEDGGLL